MQTQDQIQYISDALSKMPDHTPIGDVLKIVERALIEQALYRNKNVTAKAAIELGIGRTTLVEKIKRHIGPIQRPRLVDQFIQPPQAEA